MNRAINVLINDEVKPLALKKDQVLQTIGASELFPHLPSDVRQSCESIRNGGGEPIILVVAPLNDRQQKVKPFNLNAQPEPYDYYVTVAKELIDVGIYSRAQVQKECTDKRNTYFGVVHKEKPSQYELYSTLAA